MECLLLFTSLLSPDCSAAVDGHFSSHQCCQPVSLPARDTTVDSRIDGFFHRFVQGIHRLIDYRKCSLSVFFTIDVRHDVMTELLLAYVARQQHLAIVPAHVKARALTFSRPAAFLPPSPLPRFVFQHSVQRLDVLCLEERDCDCNALTT